MVKYELHLNGVKQDPKQFNSPLEANKYLQAVKDAVFKNRNARPQDYKKNLAYVNSLEIASVLVSRSSDVFSVVLITEIGCSIMRSFGSIEQATDYCLNLNIKATKDVYDVMETKLRES
tara:strand:+ start:86499 stop:86855 length:357 start_codon:yes stop_codon:yes gene_type:complete